MKETHSAYDQANDFVCLLEEKWLGVAFMNLAEAQHRAEMCGCPNCLKKPDTMRDVITNEVERLTVPEPPERR